MKAFAYASKSGDLVHSDCWLQWASFTANYDAQLKPSAWPIQETVFLPGAEKRELKGKVCVHCGLPFKAID